VAGRAPAPAARPLWGAALALPKKPAANNGTKSDTAIRFMTTSAPGCRVVPRRCPTSTWSQTAPSFARARNGWPHHAQTPGGDRRAPWACGRGGRGGASRAAGRRPRHARPTCWPRRWPRHRSRHRSKHWSRLLAQIQVKTLAKRLAKRLANGKRAPTTVLLLGSIHRLQCQRSFINAGCCRRLATLSASVWTAREATMVPLRGWPVSCASHRQIAAPRLRHKLRIAGPCRGGACHRRVRGARGPCADPLSILYRPRAP